MRPLKWNYWERLRLIWARLANKVALGWGVLFLSCLELRVDGLRLEKDQHETSDETKKTLLAPVAPFDPLKYWCEDAEKTVINDLILTRLNFAADWSALGTWKKRAGRRKQLGIFILVLALLLTKRKTFLHLEERWSPVAGAGQQWTQDSRLCNPTLPSSGRQRPLQHSGAAGTKEDNANNRIDNEKQQQSGCRGPEKLLLQYYPCFLFVFCFFAFLLFIWDFIWDHW